MKLEEIKIGETYNLRIQVLCKNEDFIIAHHETPNGEFSTAGLLEILNKYAPSFTPIPSEPGTSVPTTKHDPCRLFKKGDKVRVVECKGRCPGYNKNAIYKVGENEKESGRYIMLTQDGFIGHITVDAAYLELVTPVEEFEPYSVVDAHTHWDVAVKDMKTIASYSKVHHPHAKEAAEAERDRLNAEWRKEQE